MISGTVYDTVLPTFNRKSFHASGARCQESPAAMAEMVSFRPVAGWSAPCREGSPDESPSRDRVRAKEADDDTLEKKYSLPVVGDNPPENMDLSGFWSLC